MMNLFQTQWNTESFFLLAGPCAIEGREMAIEVAEKILGVCTSLNIPFVFKGSYKKANRTRLDSFTGIGDQEALEILAEIKQRYNIPVVSDVHTAEEAKFAAQFVDVLQIPAFLCRQTELLIAAAETGKFVNIKKGQFLSGESMSFAVEKVRQSGNNQIMLTERGTMFGYQDLIVDYRNIPIMQENNVPVVMDCTHSLQQPNQVQGVTGGNPGMIETIAKAAIAVGVDGLFIETHPNPQNAKSDGANMLHLDYLEALLKKLVVISRAVNEVN